MIKNLMDEQIDICKQYQYIVDRYGFDMDAFSLYNTIEKTHESCKPYLFTHEYDKRMWDRHEKVTQCVDDVVSGMVIEHNIITKQYNDFLKFHKNLEGLEG